MVDDVLKKILDKFRDDMVFYLFDDGELKRIVSYFELIHYPKGTTIYREGEMEGDFMGFVFSGKLEVKKQTEFKGKQIIIALLGSGALVGELSMFDEQGRSATVVALEETTILILRREALDTLIQEDPYLGIKLLKGFIRILSLRLRKSTERLTTIF